VRSQPLPVSLPAGDGYNAWVARMCPALVGKNASNFANVLRLARIDPELDIQGCSADPVIMAPWYGQAYVRIFWAEERGWQRPTAWCTHPWAKPLHGGHGTTEAGLGGILRDRALRRVNHEGVYAYMTDQVTGPNSDSAEWLRTTMEKAANSPKNVCGILCEVQARCYFERVPGGVGPEGEACTRGIAAHASKSNGGRWLLPEPFLEFVGLWVPVHGMCCDGLPGAVRFRV